MDAVKRGKLSLQGFVAYMKRKDAETAVRELDGAEWGEAKLKVGFSKPVPIPQRALYGEFLCWHFANGRPQLRCEQTAVTLAHTGKDPK